MWHLLFVPAVLAAAARPRAYQRRALNNTASAQIEPPQQSAALVSQDSPPDAPSPIFITLSDAPSPIFVTLSDKNTKSPSSPAADTNSAPPSGPSPIFITLPDKNTKSPSGPVADASSASPSGPSPIFITLPQASTTRTTAITPSIVVVTTSISQLNSSSTPSQTIQTLTPSSLQSSISSRPNGTFAGPCTGCAIQAIFPKITSFDSEAQGEWSSVVVTETVLTQFITYMLNNDTIDTVVTETETVSRTKTVFENNQTITHTTPVFVVEPTPGVSITLDAGPTYLIYDKIRGGLDVARSTKCEAQATSVSGYEPSKTEDWRHFVQPITSNSNKFATIVPLPAGLVNFLKQNPEIQSQFSGSDIATCTLGGFMGGGNLPNPSKPKPSTPSAPSEEEPSTVTEPAFTTPPSGGRTWLSTTYASTSKHVTKRGCLRCDTDPGWSTPTATDNMNGPEPSMGNQIMPGGNPDNNPENKPGNKPGNKPEQTPENSPANKPGNNPGNNSGVQPPGRPETNNQPTPTVPDIIKSIVGENPNLTRSPPPPQGQPTSSGQSITIGDEVVNIRPAEPTPSQNGSPNQQNNGSPNQQNNGSPNQQNNGSPNQQNNGSPNQQNNGSPNQQNSAPQVVIIGSETLTSGETKTINGVPVVVPTDGEGTKVVVGGSTINITPAPTSPPMPVITVGNEIVTANSDGEFVVGTETVKPGGPPVVIDGSTVSLAPSGTIAIVNGVTQTVGNGPKAPPVLTMSDHTAPATVIGGTTEFIFKDGQTLAPGRAVTVDGTTYSMPSDGQGTVVAVNGQTETLSAGSALPFNTEAVSSMVVDGTTAFVFGPSETLTLGGIITVSGTTISLPASGSGSVVIVNGATSTLGQVVATSAAPLTIDGKTVTATVRDGTTEYVVNSETTLKPDGEMIVRGTTYSLDPNGTVLVINGVSSTIASTPATNSAKTTRTFSSRLPTTSEDSSNDSGVTASGTQSSTAAGMSVSHRGLDTWIESLIIGAAGWMIMLL